MTGQSVLWEKAHRYSKGQPPMRKSKYNSSGSGPKPRLGAGKPNGLARPASSKSGNGIHAGRGSSTKAARPGGVTKAPKGGGSGGLARPGGAQGISR